MAQPPNAVAASLAALAITASPETTKAEAFKAKHARDIDTLRAKVTTHPDFPKPGIQFKNFLPITRDAVTQQILGNLLYEYYKDMGIDVVVGYEARGWIVGMLLAPRLGAGFVELRKPSKLPGELYTEQYGLEYGKDCLCLSKDANIAGKKVLLLDDVIATGGTAVAGINLVKQAGGIPVGFGSLLEIVGLEGRKKVESQKIPNFDILNLIDKA